MAKVKKLQVRTPQTTDGKTLAYDKDEKVIYKTSIVEIAAKKDFENLNAKLPSHLKHKLEEIEIDTDSKTEKVKSVDDTALKAKDAEIAALKEQLAKTAKKGDADKTKDVTVKADADKTKAVSPKAGAAKKAE